MPAAFALHWLFMALAPRNALRLLILHGACAALIAMRQEMLAGKLEVELDPTDVEYSLLKQGLLPRLPYGMVPSLASPALAHPSCASVSLTVAVP